MMGIYPVLLSAECFQSDIFGVNRTTVINLTKCIVKPAKTVVRLDLLYIQRVETNPRAPRACAADQRLCFRSIDSAVPLFPKSEILSIKLSSVAVHDLCRT